SLLPVISHAHPADHYSAAAIIQHGLRSIESESSVEFVKCTMFKTPFFCIKTAGEISCLIQVLITVPFCLIPLRTDNKYIFSIEPEQIRALPHVTEIAESVDNASGSRSEEFSIFHVIRLRQNRFALPTDIPGAENHQPAAAFIPHFRVSEMRGITVRKFQYRTFLLKVHTIIRNRQTLIC